MTSPVRLEDSLGKIMSVGVWEKVRRVSLGEGVKLIVGSSRYLVVTSIYI
jgi:hypothetical protein